jgi:hypothetical protein
LSDWKQNYLRYVSKSDRIYRLCPPKNCWQKKLLLGIGGTT